MIRNKNNQHGQTLVEAIIAISVVVMLVTGLIAGTSASLKTSQSGRSRYQAVKLAEEGLEYARSLRDTSWSTLTAYTGTHCFDPSSQTPLVATSDNTCVTKKNNFRYSFYKTSSIHCFRFTGDSTVNSIVY